MPFDIPTELTVVYNKMQAYILRRTTFSLNIIYNSEIA
jgi:hypothetical protein